VVVSAEKPSQLLTSRKFKPVYENIVILRDEDTMTGHLEINKILDYPVKTRINIIMESDNQVNGELVGFIRTSLCEYFQMCRYVSA